MQLTRWEPAGLASLRNQLDRLFDSFREPGFFAPGDWVPALDEVETAEEVIVKIELPGMDEKDISVTLSGNNLVIKGERKAEKEEKNKHYHKMERSHGRFERMVALPSSIEMDKISAEYRKGVLEVHLPKKAEDQPKQIPVKGN